MKYGRVYATTAKLSRGRPTLPQLMKEKPMRRTLKQRIRDWLNNDQDQYVNEIVRSDDVNLSRDNSLRFEIHQASGGRVVQTRRYDEKKDRHFENLYIITSDQDFGHEIDKIITMEALRG
jgi:hypothetical protein